MRLSFLRILVGLFIEPLLLLAARCPPQKRRRWGTFLGKIAGRLLFRRREVIRSNLRRAFPSLTTEEEQQLITDHLSHLGESLIELFAFARLPPEALRELIVIEGEEHLREALEQGRGALICSAHLGNWELLLRAGLLSEVPVTVLSKRLRISIAQLAWERLRRSTPMRLDENTFRSARTLRRRLKAGQIVADVIDQHAPSPRAMRLPFFGHSASTSATLARLSLQSGAPLLTAFITREGARHHLQIGPILSLPEVGLSPEDSSRALTLQLLQRLERQIRTHPAQWLWLHRRWKPVPNPKD